MEERNSQLKIEEKSPTPSSISSYIDFIKIEPADIESESEDENEHLPEVVVVESDRRRKSAEPVKVKNEDAGRSVPIRCHIEPSPDHPTLNQNEGSESPVDTYAIVPSATPFCEVVRVALLKLGYSLTDAAGARGYLQIKNWVPLSLEELIQSRECTVEDMLADLTSVVTLKIKLCSRSRLGCSSNGSLDVRDKLLHLLLTHSRALLQTSGCPLEKDLQSIISSGDSSMDAEKSRQFESWYKLQLERMKPPEDDPRDYPERHVTNSPSMTSQRDSVMSPPRGDVPAHVVPESASPRADHVTSPREAATRDHVTSPREELDSRSSSPKLPSNFPRPRFRTSFDPDIEIPRLQQWFAESSHPSRERMLHYLQVLNSLGTRKNRKPLDLTNIIYWFKNARAAQRRASRTTELDDDVTPADIPQLPNKNAVYMFSPHKESETETRTEFKNETVKTEDEALDMTKKSSTDDDNNIMDSDSNSGDDVHELDYSSPYRPDLLPHQMPQLHLVPMHYRLNTLMQAHTNLQQQHYYSSMMQQRSGLMDERRKRTRVFIDPLTEIPKLEAWFLQDSHPTSYMIEKYSEELNTSEYRQRFPKLEPKNIQLWFKNHRAKVKRARIEAENKTWEDRAFHNGC